MILEIQIGKEVQQVPMPDISTITLRQVKDMNQDGLTEYEQVGILGVPEGIRSYLTYSQVQAILDEWEDNMVKLADVQPSLANTVTLDGNTYTFPADLTHGLTIGQANDIETLIKQRGVKLAVDAYPIILAMIAEDGTPYSSERSARMAPLIYRFYDVPAVTAFAVGLFFCNGATKWSERLRQHIPSFPYLFKQDNEPTPMPLKSDGDQ